MSNHQIRRFRWDEHIREGIEYLDSFWALIPKYMRMRELEREFAVAMLAQERSNFHRRCADNNKPGKRHMLPFYWSSRHDYQNNVTHIQVPITVGSPMYERKMAEFDAKIKAARHGG